MFQHMNTFYVSPDYVLYLTRIY